MFDLNLKEIVKTGEITTEEIRMILLQNSSHSNQMDRRLFAYKTIHSIFFEISGSPAKGYAIYIYCCPKNLIFINVHGKVFKTLSISTINGLNELLEETSEYIKKYDLLKYRVLY